MKRVPPPVLVIVKTLATEFPGIILPKSQAVGLIWNTGSVAMGLAVRSRLKVKA
jgi:hypothetical protein